MQRRSFQFGFTLVELLVVTSIIMVLIAILLPALKSARYAANLTLCAARQRQVVQAGLVYATDNNTVFPPTVPTYKHNNGPDTLSNPYYINYHGDDNLGRYPAISKYIGSTLNDAEVLMCPMIPSRPADLNPRYWNSRTHFLKSSFGIWWSWWGYKNQGWTGPMSLSSTSKLLTTDMLYWTGHQFHELRFNHPIPMTGYENSEDYESFWIDGGVTALVDVKPTMTLNAGYVDGHVELMRFSDTDQKTIDGEPAGTSQYAIPKIR
ncbi:MAG: hypothetical protein GC162_06885 [Planctomycetes bacterium]|nr:hypothetical protein [Planctomycetota bacterium]